MKYKEIPNFIFLITLSFIIIGFIASISAKPLSFDIEEVTSSIQPSKRDIYDKRSEDFKRDYDGDDSDDSDDGYEKRHLISKVKRDYGYNHYH
ncbi:9812_t:CDS:2, partial [Dentiscutata erythropus]